MEDNYQAANFDIISQLVADISSNLPKRSYSAKLYQKTEQENNNGSFFKIPEIPESNMNINLDESKITRKRKVDTSVLLEIHENKNETNFTKQEQEIVPNKKPKTLSSLKNLDKFAFVSKPQNEAPKVSESIKKLEIRITQQSQSKNDLSQRMQVNNLDLNNDDLEIDL